MMVYRRGFTLIEIAITLTILLILLSLAVINFNSHLSKARDAERESNVKAIAALLESYARNRTSSSPGSGQGYYPPAEAINTESGFLEYLPEADRQVFQSPDSEDYEAFDLVIATRSHPYTEAHTVRPKPSMNTYVYQPLKSDGSLCLASGTDKCTSFNLFYLRENQADYCTGSGNNFCKVESQKL